MTAVFVHGNPETAAVWGPMLDVLSRSDVATLSPPGFGAPVPAGFGASSDDYVDWLEGELEGRQEPVDLVGHDWGGGHVIRLVCRRPELVRSWCTDIAGCFAPDYVWHDMAQAWQTPGVGEEAMGAMVAMAPADRAGFFEALGLTPAVAGELAAAVNEDMARCVLALYRSAQQPAMARWGEEMPAAAARPGLVLIPTNDGYTGGPERARAQAQRARAQVATLDGLGHWWMVEDPRRGAAALEEFWATLG